MNNLKEIKITWFGRCCFLIEGAPKSILFDPYDTSLNVDMGRITADLLITSSVAHDHGEIGASPHAMIYGYPGKFNESGILITGIEGKENRGTPTIVFNVKIGPFSITNFADLGTLRDDEFKNSLSEENRQTLASTNIAFIRPSIIEENVTEHNTHNEKAKNYFTPGIILPEHYHPKSFIEEHVPEKDKDKFYRPNIVVDEMVINFGLPLEEINSYSRVITTEDLKTPKIIKFLRLPEQVKYD